MEASDAGTSYLELDKDDEVVEVEAHPSGDSAHVSISCSDATGLGCDIARVLFNFGLTVYNGDFSTDGRWCFVMLHVKPCFGSPPCATNWSLLKRNLLRFCSSEKTMRKAPASAYTGNKKFILQIEFQDRIGTLHKIIHSLWESELVVHKANISTSPDNTGLDVFYVSDKLDRLPRQARVSQIEENIANKIKDCSSLRVNCLAYPSSRLSSGNSSRLLTGTRDCKDSRSSLPLMKTLSNRERGGSRRSSNASQDLEMLPRFSISEILESLKVHADNLVSSTQTVFHIECPDRKGLMYDLFRITKDIGLQISYCKVTLDMNVCKADLFVHEEERQQKLTDEMIEFFCAEIKNAITSSILLKVENRHDAGGSQAVLLTEVVAVAPVDSGFRGRPRVLYDLTATFNQLGLSIFHAEMYTVEISGEVGDPSDRRYQEVHKFVIQDARGKPISSKRDLELVEKELYARLVGSGSDTSVRSTEFKKLANLLDYGVL